MDTSLPRTDVALTILVVGEENGKEHIAAASCEIGTLRDPKTGLPSPAVVPDLLCVYVGMADGTLLRSTFIDRYTPSPREAWITALRRKVLHPGLPPVPHKDSQQRGMGTAGRMD